MLAKTHCWQKGYFAAAAAAIAVLLYSCAGVVAQDAASCAGFDWPLDKEIAWLSASDSAPIQSGAEIAATPEAAIVVALKPGLASDLPFAPGVKKQGIGPDTFSGWITIKAIGEPGLYQISLSHNGWIDVGQAGRQLNSVGFTGRRECTILRKSVRYDIGAGPVIVQVAGVPVDKVKITVRRGS